MVNSNDKPEKNSIISKSDTQEIVKLLQNIESILELIHGYRKFPYDEKGAEALQKGKIELYKYRNYYDVDKTITTAAPNNPNDFDSPVYQRERVYVDLQRNADLILIANDGPGTLFVIVSHGGEVEFSQETQIFAGDTKMYYNVYELRVRSPIAGLHYRITEYDIRTGTFPANRSSFTAQSLQNLGLPGTGTQLPNISIPDGFALVVRASVANTGSVFIANSQANTNITTSRITLLVGNFIKLFITNANLIWAAGSVAGQNIDILVEQ